MAKTITVIKSVPKKEAATSSGTKKISIKRVPKSDSDGEPIELKQKFIATHSEKGITIIFGNMKFGVMRGDTKTALENFMRGTEAKDTAKVQPIIAIVKTYMKSGLSDKQICCILNATQAPSSYAQTLQVYLNQLKKKPEAEPVTKATEVADNIEAIVMQPGEPEPPRTYISNFVANEFGDDDHGLDPEQHGHLFVGAGYHFPEQLAAVK